MVTRVGAWSRDTAVTVHQTPRSSMRPQAASAIQVKGEREEMEEESSLLVTRGSEAAEMIRLHTPEMASYHENISFMHTIYLPPIMSRWFLVIPEFCLSRNTWTTLATLAAAAA